ncbi:hypothetical protein CDEF62S_03022 [Castellaniella defragrans]
MEQSLLDLWYGFHIAFEPHNLMWSVFGVIAGNLVGVLPGLGSIAAISILLPITYAMSPVAAILMLAGIFYGSMYGGAIGAILLNLPVHAPHAATCLDGYPLTLKGRGGAALGVAMMASFFAASIGILVMAVLHPRCSPRSPSSSARRNFSRSCRCSCCRAFTWPRCDQGRGHDARRPRHAESCARTTWKGDILQTVRSNSGGNGARLEERVTQQSIFTRKGRGPHRSTMPSSAARLNDALTRPDHEPPRNPDGIAFAMPYWDERFLGHCQAEYPDVKADQYRT